MTDGSGFPPPPPPPSRWEEPPPPPYDPGSANLLKPVGITLVIYNAFSILSGLMSIVMLEFAKEFMAKLAEKDKEFQQIAAIYDMPWMGALNWVGLVLAIIGLIGSIYLLRGRNYGLAMTGAIVTMLNPGGACCCAIGTAFGIWGLVVMLKPEAQAVFNRP